MTHGMTAPIPPYYRRDLALVHHFGYGQHAEACAPGILAIDLCDLEWGEARREATAVGRVTDDWAIVTEFDVPASNRFVRHIAVFVRNDDGSWRRDDERHDNVLVDTARIPAFLADHGVEASAGTSFGDERLPAGLRTIIGRRR